MSDRHHRSPDLWNLFPASKRYDRRFWVRWYAGVACFAVIVAVVAESPFSRVGMAIMALAFVGESLRIARDRRVHGRWIGSPDAATQAAVRRAQRAIWILIPVALVVGLVIGLT